MIVGALIMQGIVMIGVLLFTLCSSSCTLCSSSLILCYACGVAFEAGGVRMDLIFACSFLMSVLTIAVVPALVFTLDNSLVSALKCWWGVRFGTWQCCGNSSVDPKILYAPVLATKYRSHW